MVTPKTPPAADHATDALTPPPSDSKDLLPTNRILALLRKFYYGLNIVCSPWKSIRLPPPGYEELVRNVNADASLRDFLNDKARFDYNNHTQQFILRMPTTVHETFIEQVVADILDQLRTLGSSDKSCANFARSIKSLGSSRIVFKNSTKSDHTSGSMAEETYIRREPDASFAHESARYPGVIIEVSYSQKRRSVPHLAEDYILESNGNIRFVVGLDIEYRGTKQATVSIWCPRITKNEHDGQSELVLHNQVEDQIFRDENGTASDSVSLSIPLSSFAPNRISSTHLLDGEEVTISPTTLCRYLEIAESRSFAEEGGLEDSPPKRKRRRLRTPPEELNSEDEALFLVQEEDSADRAIRDDSSFKAPSSSQGSH